MTSISSVADLERRSSVASNIRNGLRQAHPPIPGSPRTPQHSRHLHSPYASSSSPGSSFRQDEDAVIFELGSRWLRAGFEGNSLPTCLVGFGPEEARRVGDYRGWIRGGDGASKDAKPFSCSIETWSEKYELWRSDIRDFDLELFEDKIERAVRTVYNMFLLTDAGSSRLILVLPSIVPHPLLASLMSTIFHRWKYSSITLLPSPAMATISAGLRSSLVVDIGWEETNVTAVYEYREIQSKRSTRATKMLMQRFGKLLTRVVREHEPSTQAKDEELAITFDLCEEIATRLAWCRKSEHPGVNERDSNENSNPTPSSTTEAGRRTPTLDSNISLPLPIGTDSTYTDVPFSLFSEPVEDTFFNTPEPLGWDDEDVPLEILIYDSLLSLAPDIRGTCMSRIIFTGGGANIPGLRQRIMDDVGFLINKNKWSLARGEILSKLKNLKQKACADKSASPASEPPEEPPNFIDEKFENNRADQKPYVHGVLRQVDTLGPWAGASLLASLKIKGLVEVEREKFLQHGLTGATRDGNVSSHTERRSGYGSGIARSGGDRSSWTLGEWG
ncbi:hypothetical protein FQN57_002973 [Myotisia sp. PD_48]|nr:hypothetical protein FQN57_002973 [Myotisia sp. PD_48]